MRILLIFTLLAFMTGCVSSFIVPGYSGGTVIIYCHYNRGEERNWKYFCVRKTTLSCKDQIRSGSQNTWEHRGRFSLYDDTEGNYFMVVIRQLTRQDEGIYWCGVDISVIPDRYTKVELEVKEDECCNKSVTETVHLGGEVNIVCNYPEKQENSNKYFCKEDNDSKTCDYRISDEIHSSPKNGKYSLGFYNKKVEKSFTVTISNLTEDDTGTYWCGVENRAEVETWREDNYISLITEVHLNVTVSATKTTTKTTPTTTSTNSSSSPPSVHRHDTPLVLLVRVCLVVFLQLISLLIVYRWKHKTTAKTMKSSTGINGEGRHGDGDSEEIKEHPLQLERGSTTATIYTTAEFPRNPSDSLHDASVTFHKDPSCPNEATTTISKEDTSSCDYATVNVVQNSTYSTVNHPHSSSEAPPIYSIVNKPRNT
ncbi:CMRF35-like molecule 8 [Esox lucius]|uniref:Immunoglobulin domain-containing protein n=1 Tax=Esox lucius TaxID=8010 RepID=A0A3P8YFD1_ESOLU|nr:CMRF35-like molecule 8 [Esox lucius]